jgi:hypothetical protein
MKIKVCYTIYSFSWGGAEGQLIELLRHLDRDRFDPSLILWEDGNLQRVQGLVSNARVLGIERQVSGRRVSREYRAALAWRRFSPLLIFESGLSGVNSLNDSTRTILATCW